MGQQQIDALRSLYGLDQPRTNAYGLRCLMARRLVERGVRFVQIYSGGMENQRSWDGHNDIAMRLADPTAASFRFIGQLPNRAPGAGQRRSM